jgi:hypothetical protein
MIYRQDHAAAKKTEYSSPSRSPFLLLLPDPGDRADLPGARARPFDVFEKLHRGVAISAAHGIEAHVPEVS